jgi:hypothetical protein
VIDLAVTDFLRSTVPQRMASQAQKRSQVRPWAQRLCSRYMHMLRVPPGTGDDRRPWLPRPVARH